MIEGLQLLRMAMEQRSVPAWSQKIRPCELFYCRDRLRGKMADELIDAYVAAGAEALAVSGEVIDALSSRDASQGAAATLDLGVAAWALAEIDKLATAAETPKLMLILDRPRNPGNVGTLIRTADAVGASAIVAVEPCVDLFDPGVVRSSMGSLFSVPVVRTDDPSELGRWIGRIGYRFIGADGKARRTAWDAGVFDAPIALALGNEADGLSDGIRRELEGYVRLPMQGRAESLNVAVTGGILMYEWLRIHWLALVETETSECPRDG
jgi:TrmH family RNA methyltransferase